MKKLLLILAAIAFFNTPALCQDVGILDSIVFECDSLIVGRSMPIAIRVVNDRQLSTIGTSFQLKYENGASARYDSTKYLNRVVDPSVMTLRFCDYYQDWLRFALLKLTGNSLPIGEDILVEYYFTALTPGMLTLDSLHSEPTFDFSFIEDKPWPYEKFEPQFQKIEIKVVNGTAVPTLTIENNNITTYVGNSVSSNISISSSAGYDVNVEISKFSKFDNSETTANLPAIIEDNGYQFQWTPTSLDIGIWQAVIKVCDETNACVEKTILVQVVESSDYIVEFSSKGISGYHQPAKILWVDLDNDLFPDILTSGYNSDLHTTFATYHFDYDNITINPEFISSGSQYYRPTIALGYIDSDNILDAIHPVNLPQPSISVISGQDGFYFDDANRQTTLTSEVLSRSAILTDFNRDEFLDYAVSGNNVVFIYSGLGTGLFEESFKIELNEKVRSINSSDFNTNGKNDLAIGTDAGVYIYHNLGNDTFQFGEFYPQSYGTVDIDITNDGSDFNGDRYFDFVITTPSVGGEFSEIVLYEGKPNGTFNIVQVRTLKGQVFGNAVGDFNNDNHLDIAFVNGAYKYIGILYGDGNGNFLNEQRFYISDIPLFTINCVDFDLDGDMDISCVGTDNNKDGTLFILANQDNSLMATGQSFELDVLNNANLQMTSPNGKVMNNVSSSFSASSSYLKSIDENKQIDKVYSLKTIENGAYRIEVESKIDLPIGDVFSIEFNTVNEQFSLAKNIPMSQEGYTFLIYPSGTSPINPIPGGYMGEQSPMFMWNMSGDVNFQLATDINFTQIVHEAVVSTQYLQYQSDLPINDTTAYYWRVKPITQVSYDGVYVFNLVSRIATDIGDDNNLMPSEFALAQNYPNPFNPTTQLSFSLPEKSFVSMNIFNIAGQKIKTLVNKEYGAGIHVVEWDGTNAHGQKAATGIYLMKFATDKNFSKSIKMVMMK